MREGGRGVIGGGASACFICHSGRAVAPPRRPWELPRGTSRRWPGWVRGLLLPGREEVVTGEEMGARDEHRRART